MKDITNIDNLIGDKGKLNYRQFFMVCVLLFITSAEILLDYVKAGFDATIFSDTAYWVRLATMCLSIVLVTLTARDFFRERELSVNENIIRVQKELDAVHSELSKRDLMTKLENYIAEINKERKIRAYKSYLQLKMFRAKEKDKGKWQKKIEVADEDALCLPIAGKQIKVSMFNRVRYNKINISTLFARSGKTSNNDDEDLESNESAIVGEMLYKKLLPLVAFSVAFSTLFFDNGTFAVAILINTFTKLFRIALSMYTGAVSGQDFVKVALLSKMERRLDLIQKFLEKERLTSRYSGNCD